MDRLDAVAVVDVEVDVQDAQAVAPRARDRQRGVVVDAEPRRAIGHRVVQPAAGVEGVLDVAPEDGLDRPQRAAGHRRAGLVHPGERRIVAALADAGRTAHRTAAPRTAARRRCSAGVWHHSSSSSVAGSGARPGSAPTERRRSIPGPNRRGVSGWPGPKS